MTTQQQVWPCLAFTHTTELPLYPKFLS